MEDVLRRVSVFADLETADFGCLAALFVPQHLPADHVVFRHGDPSDAFYIVEAGSVVVFRDEIGKPIQLLARLGPGEFFGELGLFDGLARSASARTCEEARLLKIENPALLAFLDQRPEVAVRLQVAAAQRHSRNVAAALDLGKRQDVRIRLDRGAILELPSGWRQRTQLLNLSSGGACLRGLPSDWQAGHTVHFRLCAGPHELPLTARIAWRKDDIAGLAFRAVAPDHDARVRQLLRHVVGG